MDDGSWPPLSVELYDINQKYNVTYIICKNGMDGWMDGVKLWKRRLSFFQHLSIIQSLERHVVWMRLHKRIEPRCRLRVLRHDDGPRGLMIAKQTGWGALSQWRCPGGSSWYYRSLVVLLLLFMFRVMEFGDLALQQNIGIRRVL